ncbi:hypothetical protein ACBJ59_12915 [Nonomuraea sp. MTCD27]|uniref:hypothetical protein n=1 Tax=Nonomuraea sp. MTCD27 TaxID=1676747 RepID=UPI0035C0FC45
MIFTEDEPWFINSYNWHSILERSTATSMRPADREKFDEHINVVGVNFPLIEQAADRRAVAEFLLGLVEDIQCDFTASGEKDMGAIRKYGDLAQKVRSEIGRYQQNNLG